MDETTEVEFYAEDGDEVKNKQLLGVIRGDIRVLLSGEHAALNYLQRMSEIATYTHQIAELLKETKIKLLDTRKTTPNMRIFEKYAVKVGGGYNHRYNLSDGILLKDNHIGAAGSVRKAVEMAKEYAPFVRKIEIETENLEMVKEAVEAGADIIMLDNMTPEVMKEAVKLIDGRAETECSGNVTKENIERLVEVSCRLYFQRGFDTFLSDFRLVLKKSSRGIDSEGKRGFFRMMKKLAEKEILKYISESDKPVSGTKFSQKFFM